MICTNGESNPGLTQSVTDSLTFVNRPRGYSVADNMINCDRFIQQVLFVNVDIMVINIFKFVWDDSSTVCSTDTNKISIFSLSSHCI